MKVICHTTTDTNKQISYAVPLTEFDRSDRTWAEFFIRGVEWVSTKSKDRSTKVGALAVNWNSKAVLGFGYNGFPRGVNDDLDERHARPAKYGYTEHAERNLCYNSSRHGIGLEGSWMFMQFEPFPCVDCARAVIQSGIVAIVGTDIEFPGVANWADSCAQGKEMLLEAGVKLLVLERSRPRSWRRRGATP